MCLFPLFLSLSLKVRSQNGQNDSYLTFFFMGRKAGKEISGNLALFNIILEQQKRTRRKKVRPEKRSCCLEQLYTKKLVLFSQLVVSFILSKKKSSYGQRPTGYETNGVLGRPKQKRDSYFYCSKLIIFLLIIDCLLVPCPKWAKKETRDSRPSKFTHARYICLHSPNVVKHTFNLNPAKMATPNAGLIDRESEMALYPGKFD